MSLNFMGNTEHLHQCFPIWSLETHRQTPFLLRSWKDVEKMWTVWQGVWWVEKHELTVGPQGPHWKTLI